MTLSVQEQFGQIDIYVFDQISAREHRVWNAGARCGLRVRAQPGTSAARGMRDIRTRHGYRRIEHVRQLSASLETGLPAENFQVGNIERMPFADGFADVVICNSVLHFARDDRHFQAMLRELWRVLRPGGLMFCRLGSRIGMDFRQVRGEYLCGGRRLRMVSGG